MPQRHTLQRRASDRFIEDLKAAIRTGGPTGPGPHSKGYADLIYLRTGLYYAVCDFIHSSDDLENAVNLWWQVRDDVLAEHIQREPLTRPWAFYALEDREPRRRLDVESCACPPDTNSSKLPPLSLSWFGRPRGCRCEYETESEYLARFHLLTKKEREAP
jgi:hypothetical protein